MLKPRLALSCFFIWLLPFIAIAQPAVNNSREIIVHVTDDQQHALDFATISLLNSMDSSLVSSVRSDSSGNAILKNIEAGSYRICITRVNFQASCQLVDLSQPQPGAGYEFSFSLQKSGSLENVTVTGKKTAVQYQSDRTVIQVDASISNAGTNALEFLERTPGVTIDKDGNISLKGRSQVLVMIDNKPSYLSGAELSVMLAGMNSSQVESIELIDNPSAKYDAAGNGGIINIRLKRNGQKGFNGNVNLSVGQGVYSKTNNSIGLNYRNGKFNVFSNYGLNSNGNYIDMYALRTYYMDDDKTIHSLLEQPTFLKMRSNTQTLRAGVDYALSTNTGLGIVLSGTLLNRNSKGTGQAIWMNETGAKDSLIDTRSQNSTDWKNGSANLNFRHKFSPRQELTADLDWLGYNIEGDQAFRNERTGNTSYTESFKGELPTAIRIFSFKADHQLDLGNKIKLETGVKWSDTKTDNKAAYYVDQGAGWEEELSRTNNFLYAESIGGAYASIGKKSDNWSLEMGLRYEFTSYTAEQFGNSLRKDSAVSNNYGSLFPNLRVSYRIDADNELSFTIGKRVDRPPYQKLNPFVTIINKYTYMAGNPLMKPQYTHNVELSHRFRDILSTSLSYSITKDYFSQVFYRDSIGTIYYSDGNLGKRQVWGLSVGFNKTVIPDLTTNAQLDLIHKKMAGFVWKDMESSITQMNFSLTNQYRFAKAWVAELSGYYITRSQADIQEVIQPTGQVSLGISRQVLKNKGSLKLSYRDIFYTQDMEGFTLFNHATEYFKLQRDSRVATLAFTYRFGNPFKPVNKKGTTVEEMQRVGN
ncbi:outer membrane beta-barrel family protein [Flavihumibacter profundi]|jgi:iron complex outermembrane recepter protein|uniref:outer membrane beta-barrel family protein n=1 Tax=Flavihumibacter profundi TaxID=2716883 RepID=UPI001CC58CC0|nr:outer membrane beta-barrel family protein [Flavihumibacter profundi]MBZ5857626.1 TonB-dependent receptor [Flavihumibacter profundi]